MSAVAVLLLHGTLFTISSQANAAADSRGGCMEACYAKYKAPRPNRFLPGRVRSNRYLECVRECEKQFGGSEQLGDDEDRFDF
jgi:hypothetical protein